MPRYIKSKQAELHANALSKAICAYTTYFQKILGCYAGGNSKQKKWTKDHHKFVPSDNVRAVISCLRFTREYVQAKIRKKENNNFHRSLKFLDCGCGIGNIILLASAVGGYNSTGLEYEAEVCEVARILVSEYSGYSKIIQQDIVTFEHYADYDVIYYFQPIIRHEKMERFVRRVRDDAKVGAVIITYGGGSGSLYKDGRFKAIFDSCKTIPDNIGRMAHEKVRE